MAFVLLTRPALRREAKTLLPSLRPGTPDGAILRAGLAVLAERGAPVQAAATFAPGERRYVAVPTYPSVRCPMCAEGTPAVKPGSRPGPR